MAATIKTTQHNFEITEVGDVVVTPPVQDAAAGDWVRDIRIFAVPAAAGTEVPLMQIRIRAATKEVLQIVSPQSEF
jgi:hypothetical protein